MLDKQFERGQEVENEMIELTEQSAQPRGGGRDSERLPKDRSSVSLYMFMHKNRTQMNELVNQVMNQ